MKAMPQIKTKRAKPTARAVLQSGRGTSSVVPTPSPQSGEGQVPALFIHKEDVARRLGLHPRTVAVWALQQKLPAYRFGRFLRFKWAEVEQALATSFRVALPDGHQPQKTVQPPRRQGHQGAFRTACQFLTAK